MAQTVKTGMHAATNPYSDMYVAARCTWVFLYTNQHKQNQKSTKHSNHRDHNITTAIATMTATSSTYFSTEVGRRRKTTEKAAALATRTGTKPNDPHTYPSPPHCLAGAPKSRGLSPKMDGARIRMGGWPWTECIPLTQQVFSLCCPRTSRRPAKSAVLWEPRAWTP